MKVLIVGGVAGGASAAARMRRLDEQAKIIVFERGEYISFANCGLPYYLGGAIKERAKLLVQTPGSMSGRFNLDIRINSEVLRIDIANKNIVVRDTVKGTEYSESYDYLVLSPGAEPVKPPIPGIDGENIFSLRSMADTDFIFNHLQTKKSGQAVIVGGGFIGLEMAENLKKLGFEVSIIEASGQVMAPLDPEMANIVHHHLRERGIKLFLSTAVTEFRNKDGMTEVLFNKGESLMADVVILAIGVKPDSKLASDAGLEMGERGTIKVNEYMQTSDSNIYAVGDAVEVVDFINGQRTYVPLAGPANRQGRIVANNIAGRAEKYKGTQGTSIAKVFDLTVACTGNNEKTLSKIGFEYEKSYTNSGSHAGYYPGALPMTVKLLFAPTGKILGAQIVGQIGADKRIDVVATAIRAGLTVFDLEELELAYAPPFSSAKDPVNMAGFVASNILKGDVKVIHWHDIDKLGSNTFLLDVRTEQEFDKGHLAEAVNIPLNEIRARQSELPQDKEIIVYCQIGLRGYVAARILQQKGYQVRNLSGGISLYNYGINQS